LLARRLSVGGVRVPGLRSLRSLRLGAVLCVSPCGLWACCSSTRRSIGSAASGAAATVRFGWGDSPPRASDGVALRGCWTWALGQSPGDRCGCDCGWRLVGGAAPGAAALRVCGWRDSPPRASADVALRDSMLGRLDSPCAAWHGCWVWTSGLCGGCLTLLMPPRQRRSRRRSLLLGRN
jgi:hypothetical protein